MNEDGNGGTFDGFGTVGRWEREGCLFMWTFAKFLRGSTGIRIINRSGKKRT